MWWNFKLQIFVVWGIITAAVTGKHYDLPPVPPISNGVIRFVEEAICDPLGFDREMTYEVAQTGLVYKAIIDHDPSQRSDFTVLILYGVMKRRAAFWRSNNLVWTLVEGNCFSFDDIAFFKGNFYTNDFIYIAGVDTSVTYLVNVGSDARITRVAPEVPVYDHSRTYFVDFRGELLLLQMWRPEIEEGRLLTRTFLVYKLDLEEGKYYRRHHLDGCSLFIGTSSSSIIDRGQFLGCNENCIYFTAHVDCNDEEYG